jgi:hypothetical protein
VTVFPLAVHTAVVDDAKLTASPDDAVALIVKGAAPKVWLARAPKTIVC